MPDMVTVPVCEVWSPLGKHDRSRLPEVRLMRAQAAPAVEITYSDRRRVLLLFKHWLFMPDRPQGLDSRMIQVGFPCRQVRESDA